MNVSVRFGWRLADFRSAILGAALALVCACPSAGRGPPTADAGPSGDTMPDGGATTHDAGSTDAGSASRHDAGNADAGAPEPEDAGSNLPPADGGSKDGGLPGAGSADAGPVVSPGLGLTADFRAWLVDAGYDVETYARDDLTDGGNGGSFGGRTSPGQTLAHDPVVFIHGNSDLAYGTAVDQTGWAASYQYFLQNGYTLAELYATTWGPANALLAEEQYHSKADVLQERQFLQAVLAYTGASKADVIAHSMGVTLARKVVLGGMANDEQAGTYDVGPSLTTSIDAFVGIAGANLGLTNCFAATAYPTCDAIDGLYPGIAADTNLSAFLTNLLATQGYEGAFRYSIWSTADNIIEYGDIVYGTPTSRLPGQTGEIESTTYDHFQLKDLTAAAQLSLVRDHVIP